MAGKLAGAGGKKRGAFTTNAEPNVIPFIDIMLVLLIIFMVAAPKPTVDIKVDLPPPNPVPKTDQTDKPTTVQMADANGLLLYYVEGEQVEFEDLEKVLLETVPKRNPNLMRKGLAEVFSEGKVYVDADLKTKYSNVINLMNEIDQAGFKKVSLVAESASF